MAAPEDVIAYCPTREKCPRLWKARRAFESAEMLRQKGLFDCAANRYYYAVLHVAYHFVLGEKDTGKERPEHLELTSRYIRGEEDQYRQPATEAVSRAQGVRNQADYSPYPVTAERLESAVSSVAGLVVRAMQRADVQRKA
jgi:uncharacterized protein (UPF0332 family)